MRCCWGVVGAWEGLRLARGSGMSIATCRKNRRSAYSRGVEVKAPPTKELTQKNPRKNSAAQVALPGNGGAKKNSVGGRVCPAATISKEDRSSVMQHKSGRLVDASRTSGPTSGVCSPQEGSVVPRTSEVMIVRGVDSFPC